MRYDQKPQPEEINQPQVLEFLIPAVLEMSQSPSTKSNETVLFPEQAEFKILSLDGQLCTNLGYQNDWIIEATLDNTTGDPNARLEGIVIFHCVYFRM